jgi:formiminotetrahydrofolate cyclodeaminase
VTDTQEGLAALAQELASASPAEGAGVVAAGVASLAAGLCESLARGSLGSWGESRGVAIQAATLRTRAIEAGSGNARAYAAARDALRGLAKPGGTGRDANLRAALIAAADTLLAIADAAADCTALAAEIAGRCEPGERPDAAGAAELAAAAAHAAAALVEINLALLPDDERRERARSIVTAADAEREHARQRANVV